MSSETLTLSNTRLDGWGRAKKVRRPESRKYVKDY